MNIYFATWLEDNQAITLTRAEGNKRLLSYFFIRAVEDHDEFYKTYIGKGIIPHLKKRLVK